MTYTAGIDIGGTFTDCIVIDPTGRVVIGKASSTPPNFQDGVLDALASAAYQLGTTVSELLGQAHVFHGCTVGTNALVEGRTAKVGLLLTAGHVEPVYIMKSGERLKGLPPEYIAALSQHSKPEPLVPRQLVAEVYERVTSDGNMLIELDETQVRESVQKLVDAGAEAFAVSLLWSVVNDTHEVAVHQIVEEMAPDAFISRSSEVVPRVGEYERTIGAVVNSLVGPVMKTYLHALRARLKDAGYNNELGIMSCWGGLIDSRTAERFPLLTIGSGPAAGVVAARLLSEIGTEGGEDVITTDMGGTTFDVGVVLDNQPVMRSTSKYDQFEYALPTIDVRSVGAGGGSIIRYDEAMATLRVGPQSAGARPGPAAFMRGGTDATVTDADLVLGYFDADSFVGGSMHLDIDAARAALERAGEPLGFGAEQTAAAAARIVDHQMADAIRLVSVSQGRDPRQFTLYAYGGNGPVHSSALAGGLGVRRVVVPLGDLASGWSAFGVAASDAVVLEEVGSPMLHPFDPQVLNVLWEKLEENVIARLALQDVPREQVKLERLADMKYATQVNQVRVTAPPINLEDSSVDELVAEFEREYERLYGKGVGFAAAGFALTSLAVRGSARLSEVDLRAQAVEASEASALAGHREVIWYELGLDRVTTPVFNGLKVTPGMVFEGPSIVDFPVTTVVVRPDQRCEVDPVGNLTIEFKEAVT